MGQMYYPEWASSVTYAVGERVQRYSNLYECIKNHTSSSDTTPGSGEDWEEYWDYIDIEPIDFTDSKFQRACWYIATGNWDFWRDLWPENAIEFEHLNIPLSWKLHMSAIENADEISYFTNITSVFLQDHDIVSLDLNDNVLLEQVSIRRNTNMMHLVMSNLSSLSVLDVHDCPVGAINFYNHPNLTTLVIGNNDTTSIDISMLSDLKIIRFRSAESDPTKYDGVNISNNKKLKELSARQDSLEGSIITNPPYTDLEEVDLWYLEDLDTNLNFSNCPSLDEVYIEGCGNIGEVNLTDSFASKQPWSWIWIYDIRNMNSINISGTETIDNMYIAGVLGLKDLHLEDAFLVDKWGAELLIADCPQLETIQMKNTGSLMEIEIIDWGGGYTNWTTEQPGMPVLKSIELDDFFDLAKSANIEGKSKINIESYSALESITLKNFGHIHSWTMSGEYINPTITLENGGELGVVNLSQNTLTDVNGFFDAEGDMEFTPVEGVFEFNVYDNLINFDERRKHTLKIQEAVEEFCWPDQYIGYSRMYVFADYAEPGDVSVAISSLTHGIWEYGAGYDVGDRVQEDKEADFVYMYECITNHNAVFENEPGEGAEWEDYWRKVESQVITQNEHDAGLKIYCTTKYSYRWTIFEGLEPLETYNYYATATHAEASGDFFIPDLGDYEYSIELEPVIAESIISSTSFLFAQIEAIYSSPFLRDWRTVLINLSSIQDDANIITSRTPLYSFYSDIESISDAGRFIFISSKTQVDELTGHSIERSRVKDLRNIIYSESYIPVAIEKIEAVGRLWDKTRRLWNRTDLSPLLSRIVETTDVSERVVRIKETSDMRDWLLRTVARTRVHHHLMRVVGSSIFTDVTEKISSSSDAARFIFISSSSYLDVPLGLIKETSVLPKAQQAIHERTIANDVLDKAFGRTELESYFEQVSTSSLVYDELARVTERSTLEPYLSRIIERWYIIFGQWVIAEMFVKDGVSNTWLPDDVLIKVFDEWVSAVSYIKRDFYVSK